MFEGLVVKSLDVDILAGVPFMTANDIGIQPAKHQIILLDGGVYLYGQAQTDSSRAHCVRRTHVVRMPSSGVTVWLGEFVQLQLPRDIGQDVTVGIEPHCDSKTFSDANEQSSWPAPAVLQSVGSTVRIVNTSDEPKVLQ